MDREVGRTVYVYCDESGAKGYADQGEGTPGEVGVFAGILVPGSRHADVGAVFNEIASRYAPASGKLHIADLEPQLQMELRCSTPLATRAFHASGMRSMWRASTMHI